MSNQDGNQPYPSYEPPAANLASAPVVEEVFIPGGRRRPARNGLAWIAIAWKLFKKQPGTWIVFMLVWLIITIPLVVIPNLGPIIMPSQNGILYTPFMRGIIFIGEIIFPLLAILFPASVVHACDQLRQEESFTPGDLFVALSRRAGALMMLYLFTLGFILAVGIIGVAAAGAAVTFISSLTVGMLLLGVIIIIVIIAGIPIAFIVPSVGFMAMWFAPALVMTRNLSAFAAIKMSLAACLKNILSLTVFSVVMSLLLVVSAIPFGLGLLITGPMFWICSYTSYRDIFFDDSGERSR